MAEVPNTDHLPGYSILYGAITTLPMYESQVRKLKKRKKPVGFVYPQKQKKRA